MRVVVVIPSAEGTIEVWVDDLLYFFVLATAADGMRVLLMLRRICLGSVLPLSFVRGVLTLHLGTR